VRDACDSTVPELSCGLTRAPRKPLGSSFLKIIVIMEEKAECPLWSLLATSLERRAMAVANHNEVPRVAGQREVGEGSSFKVLLYMANA
jgi:hypothetical protein